MTTWPVHLLKLAWRARIESFLPVFAVLTGVVALGTAWVLGSTKKNASTQSTCAASDRRGPVFTLGAAMATAVVALILLGYFLIALKLDDFAENDEAVFTLGTLRGMDYPAYVSPDIGRFFPLNQQEFNIIRHLTTSIVGYHAIPISQLVVIACLLFFLDRKLKTEARLSLIAVCLIAPSIAYSFTSLVVPDRNVVFLLACMLCFVKRFERTGAAVWGVAAALCAQIMVYYKETAFIVPFGFAMASLVLQCRRNDGPGWDFAILRSRMSRLHFCLLSISLLYLTYYASIIYARPNLGYSDQFGLPMGVTLLYYLRVDLLAFILLGIVSSRIYLIFARKIVPSSFWDGLGFAGALWFLAVLYLRLCRTYYTATVDFIAILYVGRLVVLSWNRAALRQRAIMATATLVVVLQYIPISLFHLYERENMIRARVELADAILLRFQHNPGPVLRLYFPFSDMYPMTEFASYLVYRGLPVEGYEPIKKPVSPGTAELVSTAFRKDERCNNYRNFFCRAAGEPRRGDLLIELPDDKESNAQINYYRSGGELALLYEPQPHVPDWLRPSMTYLRAASYRWRFEELPDRWLQASMTVRVR